MYLNFSQAISNGAVDDLIPRRILSSSETLDASKIDRATLVFHCELLQPTTRMLCCLKMDLMQINDIRDRRNHHSFVGFRPAA